jgi:predicted dehydrogenase
VRVVQVGLGSWGSGWLDVLARAAGVDLVGVADVAPAARRRAQDRFRFRSGQVFESLDRALDETDADAVVVATPPGSHHDLAAAALERGRHVLTEKPLATTMADARALVGAARRADRVLMVSQNYRFQPQVRTARRLVASGRLGRLVHLELTCRLDTRRGFPPGDFRYGMRYPFLLDMAIHHVDMIRAVTGQDAAQIYCRSWPVPDSPYAHHPAAAALMTLSEGTTVTYLGDWAARGRRTSNNGEWELLGERGRLTWARGSHPGALDDGDLSWSQADEDGDVVREHVDLVDLPPADVDVDGSLQAFRRAVEDGAPAETSAADNIRSLAMVLACVESIETGAPVDVPSFVAGAPTPTDGRP